MNIYIYIHTYIFHGIPCFTYKNVGIPWFLKSVLSSFFSIIKSILFCLNVAFHFV